MAVNERTIERRLKKVYQAAYNELKKQMESFNKQYREKDALMRKKLEDEEITAKDYAAWQRSQVFIGKQWKAKVDHAADTLLHANREAMKIIDGEKMNVFADNAIYMTKQIDKDARSAFGFGIYNSEAVSRLIEKEPELLPRKVVNGKKDEAWNRVNIANAVTQGIIQGDDIPTIAKRIAEKTASTNMNAMMRYARTAMTGAENAGRIESMQYAQRMGINVKKQWLATLDGRTRHSHQLLDGQVQDVNKPFHSEYGAIRFPGDPNADPADVYNCRCTLTYVFPEYDDLKGIGNDDRDLRRDNETKEEIMNVTYTGWTEINERKKLANRYDAYYPYREALETAENMLKGYGEEHVICIDRATGAALFNATSNADDHVTLTHDELEKLAGNTMTHNHPNGSPISDTDIRTSIVFGVKEIRATHQNGVYILERMYSQNESMTPMRWRFATDYQNAYNEYLGTANQMYQRTRNAQKCNDYVFTKLRKWLKKNSEKYGWRYKEE